jgi:hypothetical protein
MKDLVVWFSLVLGALLIVTQVVIALYPVFGPKEGGDGTPPSKSAAGIDLSEILKKLTEKIPLAVAGIVLLVIAAIVAGGIEASVAFGTPEVTPSIGS